MAKNTSVVSLRYPRKPLLKQIQERRGDKHLSDTVSYALDNLVKKHFPGEIA